MQRSQSVRSIPHRLYYASSKKTVVKLRVINYAWALYICILISKSQIVFIILYVVREKENASHENGASQEIFEVMAVNSAKNLFPTFKDILGRMTNVSIL